MTSDDTKSISKFLSLILRHAPETINLTLDENGWAIVSELLEKFNIQNKGISFDELRHIVENNDKKRFAFNEDLTKIRASQGHSITIDLNIEAVEPPSVLFHGTVAKFIDAIKEEGLQKMSRQHVHLSKDLETAIKVASRRGKPIVLTIDAKKMAADGFLFFLSENNVWLTDEVPARYIQF